MNSTNRIQATATLVTIAALPFLYIGGKADITVLTTIGLAVFAIGMLTCPFFQHPPRIPVRRPRQTTAVPARHTTPDR